MPRKISSLCISAVIWSAESLLPSPTSPSLSWTKFLTQPMTSWSHKYYVLCFPRCCLMFHIEIGTIEQTTARKRMGPLILRGIILVEGVFSTGSAKERAISCFSSSVIHDWRGSVWGEKEDPCLALQPQSFHQQPRVRFSRLVFIWLL